MAKAKSLFLFKFPARVHSATISLFILAATFFIGAATPAEARYASMVVDADTGEVYNSVNADDRNYPASLTKIMTVYLLFDALDSGRVHLTDSIPFSAHAAAQAPSKIGLRPGQTIDVEDAILAIVTKSANDVAVAVSEYLGGTESAFAEQMTRKAHELGMRQTQFRNASGLPRPPNVSSARDMATLAHAMIHNHAKYYHYFGTKHFEYNGMRITTHNHLMEHYEGGDGIKTGYIAASGFNLVFSAKRNGRRLIGVVFGGQSAAGRDRKMAQLLDKAFARSPGTSGVELASMPEQQHTPVSADGEATKAAAESEGPDYRDVMKAMAAAKAGQAAPARHAKAVHHVVAKQEEEDSAGDTEEDDNWGIQVGAYSQQAKAKEAAAAAIHKLGSLVSDGEVSVIRSKGRHAIYRARVIGLPKDTAQTACKRLAKHHASCTVVNTGTTVASR